MILLQNENYSDDDFFVSVGAELLRHPSRVRVIKYLDTHKTGTVDDFAMVLGTSKNILAPHLKDLRTSAIIRGEVTGSQVVYHLNRVVFKAHMTALSEYLNKYLQ